MKLTIILAILFSNFSTTTPDLCDIVYTDAAGSPYVDMTGQTLARYCEWTGPDAPVWNANLCCDIDATGAACTVSDAKGGCTVGEPYFCEHGAVVASGVVCQQVFPSACDAGLCVAPPTVPPLTQASGMVCCSPGGVCQPVNVDNMLDCQGTYLACPYGSQNADGTVECIDF